MRTTLFSTAATLGLLLAVPAMAQTSPQSATAPAADSQAVTGARPGNVIGTGNSLPTSSNASNISRGDTHADIAPRLPVPAISDNADPRQFLSVARQALQRNQTGAAQEALERAETRLLDRSTSPENMNAPDQGPMIQQITDARQALSRGDKSHALQVISAAMAAGGGGSGTMGAAGPGTGATMGTGMGTGAAGGGTASTGTMPPAASKSMGNNGSASGGTGSTSK
jgi:hypothetical protein